MLLSIAITLVIGILYGVSLLLTQKLLVSSKKPMLAGIISLIRLACLGIFFQIMLKSNQIHPIILVTSLLSAYWLTILLCKELIDARK